MDLILAAAGKSSRFQHESYSGPKALFEISGKPFLGHIIDRILDIAEVKQLIVVGAKDTADGGKIYEYARETWKHKGLNVKLIETERKGFAYALWQGTRELLEHEVSERALLMPCDTFIEKFSGLEAPTAPVAIALTPLPFAGSEKYSHVGIKENGELAFWPNSELQNQKAVSGFFSLAESCLAEFDRLFTEVVSGKSIEPRALNSTGEFRITWIWPKLEELGFKCCGVDTGALAEINFPEQLASAKDLIKRTNEF